jgi:hypothetical protein
MDLEALGGAAAIALGSTFLFVLIARSWQSLSTTLGGSTRFPNDIMVEAAQRFRDQLDQLGRLQTMYLSAALVFAVIFATVLLLRPQDIFGGLPKWQLAVIFLIPVAVCGYGCYRLFTVVRNRRNVEFVRDANMAIGHGLQSLTSNQNRVFHDVRCGSTHIDNVVVGLHGIYAVYVIANRPGKDKRVRLNGDNLAFAPGKVSMSLDEFGQISQQFARACRKHLQHDIRVRSVIAVPGWEIEAQASDRFLVVNERSLPIIKGWREQKDFLMNEDVATIHKLLTKLCTRFTNGK